MFGFQGIWQGVAVLYDRSTDSEWLHLSGECIRGQLKGKTLKPISGTHTTWKQWRTWHPETEVMDWNEHFAGRYPQPQAVRRGRPGLPEVFKRTIQTKDARLSPSALVYGITSDDESKAYAFEQLKRDTLRVVNDQVGNLPVVVLFDPKTESCTAFVRRLGEEEVQFEVVASSEPSSPSIRVVDGSDAFDLTGRCIDGSRQGLRLQPVGLQAEWYGWYATYPKTKLWSDKQE